MYEEVLWCMCVDVKGQLVVGNSLCLLPVCGSGGLNLGYQALHETPLALRHLRDGKITQRKKCLLYKHRDLSLDPPHPGKICTSACVHSPSTVRWGQRQADPMGLLVSQSNPVCKPPVQ